MLPLPSAIVVHDVKGAISRSSKHGKKRELDPVLLPQRPNPFKKNKKRILKNDADLGKQETRANVERTDYFAPTTEIISV